MQTVRTRLAVLALAGSAALLAGGAQAQSLLFWSTQANPVEETQAMRDEVLAGFEGEVDYQSSDPGPFLTRIQAELQAGSGHDRGPRRAARRLRGAARRLRRSRPARARSRRGAAAADGARQARHGEQKYMPWMQATYVMAANKQALEYLPEGADINALTYDQLIEWIEGDGRGDRRPEVRLPRRSGGAQAPLLPGLPAARLHRLDGDRVPLGRRGRGLGEVQGALAVHEPGLDRATTSCRSRCSPATSGSPSTTPPASPRPSTRSPTTSSPSRRRPGRRAAPSCR